MLTLRTGSNCLFWEQRWAYLHESGWDGRDQQSTTSSIPWSRWSSAASIEWRMEGVSNTGRTVYFPLLSCPYSRGSFSVRFLIFCRSYFHHAETGRSQWNPPRFLRSPAQVQAFLAANREKEEIEEGENQPETSPLLLPKALSVSTSYLVSSFIIPFVHFILKQFDVPLREQS